MYFSKSPGKNSGMQRSAAAVSGGLLFLFLCACWPLLHFSSLLIFLSLYPLINQVFFLLVALSLLSLHFIHHLLVPQSLIPLSLLSLVLVFCLSLPFLSSGSCQSHLPPSIIHLSVHSLPTTGFLFLSSFLFFSFFSIFL